MLRHQPDNLPLDNLQTLNVKDQRSKVAGLINHETVQEQVRLNQEKLVSESMDLIKQIGSNSASEEENKHDSIV